MRLVIPKHGQQLTLLAPWTPGIVDGNQVNNKFLAEHLAIDVKHLRAHRYGEITPNTVDVTFPAGTVFILHQLYTKKPYGSDTVDDASLVRLRLPRQKGHKKGLAFEVDFTDFMDMDAELSEAPASWQTKALEKLATGQMVEVAAARIAPGSGIKGRVYLFSRESLSVEKLREKQYLVLRKGSGFTLGKPAPAPSGWRSNQRHHHLPYGSNRTWLKYHRESDILGWATDSSLTAIAESLRRDGSKEE